MSPARPAARPTRARRALAVAALVAAAAGALGAGTAVDARPAAASPAALTGDGAAAARTIDLVNDARAAEGLAPLGQSPETDRVATDWAFRMAAAGRLEHNPDLGRQLTGWSLVAENVGVGADAEQLDAAFHASPGHRANVLREDVTQLGVGAVRGGDGRLWVVQVFKLPAGVVAPPRGAAPAPAPEPAAAAAPTAWAPAPALRRATREVADR
ncbi:CAP domain-containing protein [Kineococcus terrestris]|uniref:CAP domain-containing protein n=1 Tax=Kineococcus terrestris TaxID=2044856 RepID=UPI0034DB29D3